MAIAFSADDLATLTLSGGAAPTSKQFRTFTVSPFRRRTPLASLPRGWRGTFQSDITENLVDQAIASSEDIHLVFQGTIEWGVTSDPQNPAPRPEFGGKVYVPLSSTLTVTGDTRGVAFTPTSVATCTSHYTSSMSTVSGHLELDGRGRYKGSITGFVTGERSETCVNSLTGET